MLNKFPTEHEIFGFKVDHSAEKINQDFLYSSNFGSRYQENWQVTGGFWLWLFLSWGINYRIKNAKTKFEKFTSSNFCHPISHCAPSVFLICVCG